MERLELLLSMGSWDMSMEFCDPSASLSACPPLLSMGERMPTHMQWRAPKKAIRSFWPRVSWVKEMIFCLWEGSGCDSKEQCATWRKANADLRRDTMLHVRACSCGTHVRLSVSQPRSRALLLCFPHGLYWKGPSFLGHAQGLPPLPPLGLPVSSPFTHNAFPSFCI